ncbi:Sulfur/thiosulfate oxidation protein SoxZ [Candidatus Terasakiella magnetica]|uniref:Sulfur/thiosulfate oxidation protein SoxZ n=1 Tax=Candidatus Terasakiella magnetica TaxID=1867952 RepID=A0A1C3RJN9_9PROT|nr:thiosulfate oxidation carrier complex protein SoxZ [Candidatus Terasakiella magnetica]SCA57459.1 Sulfur/thiosulfate oxidation protein SoxZ [Candidatus Terasakiella magnetica]
MAKAPKPRVKAPKKAEKGDVVTIKTTISHRMESGQRKGKDGKKIPKRIINKFEALFNGKTIMSADLFTSISANPYIDFDMLVTEAGQFEFKWYDDNGDVYTKKSKMKLG